MKWVQMTFTMDSGDVVTTDWQDVAKDWEDQASSEEFDPAFNPFPTPKGPFAPDMDGLTFCVFPCRDYEGELLYVRPSKVETFRVEFRESEDKPE